MLSVKDLDVKGKKVLLRVELNVPLDEKGSITDLTRIEESIPTIEFILNQGGKVILLSHIGNSGEKKQVKQSLAPCGEALSKILKRPVLFAKDCLGEETKKMVADLQNGEVLLLENLRFYPAEEKPEIDPSFAIKLASYGDLYVNDAFGGAHREHSSIISLPSYFPKKSAAGFLLEKEIAALSSLSHCHPFHALIGGAKISSKLGVLNTFLKEADALYVGGAMAFTFLKAQGMPIGNSLYEPHLLNTAKEILDKCKETKTALFLPLDLVVTKDNQNNREIKIINTEEGIEEGWKGMDIGPKTLLLWEKELKKAAAIFWNGPMGVFELPPFAEGTLHLAKFLSSLNSKRIIGGGDSIAAINKFRLASFFTHISTGGGASLKFLESGTLPGIEALKNKIN